MVRINILRNNKKQRSSYMPGEIVVLKKYSNRRLYDTGRSIYVTIAQVAELIRSGREVKVVDAKTEEDVTAFILTQIILEEAKKKNTLLPVPLLVLIIRYGDNILQEFFEKYLEQTVKNYLAYRGEMDRQFGKWLELSKGFSDMAGKALSGIEPFRSMFEKASSPDKGRLSGDNKD
jgi:polyhydroxyalkanoate synthesis repressor PhaR